VFKIYILDDITVDVDYGARRRRDKEK